MGHLGVAVLDVIELGTAVLGVAVLGTAVLHPAPHMRPSFPKVHHTARSGKPNSRRPEQDATPWCGRVSGNQGTMAPSKTGHLGVAVLGVAELGTTVIGSGQFIRQEQYRSRQHVQ